MALALCPSQSSEACNVECTQKDPSLLKKPAGWHNQQGYKLLVLFSPHHLLPHRQSNALAMFKEEVIARQVFIATIVIVLAEAFQHLLHHHPHQSRFLHCH